MFMLGPTEKKALLLSTLAGLSTSIGGFLAIIKEPDNKLLSLLLGIAIGVMATLSAIEMYIHNAIEHGFFLTTLFLIGGGMTYYLLQPYFPDFNGLQVTTKVVDAGNEGAKKRIPSTGTLTKRPTNPEGSPSKDLENKDTLGSSNKTSKERARTAELLRLGTLMSLTMTLHNLPEGFAVAFSSFTDFGPYMALAIAIHNIPEGIIVAAPVYAATGSRVKAMGIAFLSGISEPVGALLALNLVDSVISEEMLHYFLAYVGGIMLAVCFVELWPEARKCQESKRLYQGISIGSVIMGVTLAAGI